MASENLKIDENSRNVLGGVTNDASEFIKNLRVNPLTGRLIVDAHLTSTNTDIGDTIAGGTAGSILFLGLGSTLAQDNANLFYDDTNNFVGFGTNTPDATVHIDGTFRIDTGSAVAGYVWTATDSNGNGEWQAGSGVSGVTQIVAGDDITVSPGGGTGVVTVSVDVAALATDTTFIDDLIANTYFTTNLANDNNFITELTSNSTFITNLSGTVSVVTDGVTITGDGTAGDPLVAVTGGGGTVTTVSVVTANGFAGTVATATTTPAITLTTTESGLLLGDGTTIFGAPFAQGDIFYGSGTNALGVLNKDTNATRYLSNTGTTNNPAWSQVNLSNGITDTLPIGNGGTGQTTAITAFDALSPTTTKGDLIVNDGTNNVRQGVGTNGQILVADSGETNGIKWADNGSEVLKVGVGGSSNTQWFNIQFPFLVFPTNDGYFTMNVSSFNPMAAFMGNGNKIVTEFGGGAGFLTNMEDNDTLQFGNTNKKKIIVEGVISASTDNASAGWGLAEGTGVNIVSSSTERGVGFVKRSNVWNAYAGDGSAGTLTPVTLSTSSGGDKHVLRVEFDPLTPEARYYVDGSLQATITTNLPLTTGAGTTIGFASGNNSSAPIFMTGAPTFAVEI